MRQSKKVTTEKPGIRKRIITVEHRLSEYRSTKTSVTRKRFNWQIQICSPCRFEECVQGDIQDWLECDDDEPGYQVLVDDEIFAHVVDEKTLCDDEEKPSDSDRADEGTIK
ncbi:hypothetical protein AVEN_141723-1 [Araneus ventricosus]|uniref:Uncharacterized protein n=1 Tax=Araneus ventricosus TaxID=182803 RepID=A0A4Y2J4T5_ARAVE|nr:hypothetical protein AVEN_141723-1 [Araneus ventricosus]